MNENALRAITDDTGGRTEIVRGFGDLDAATARIADELSKQYYLGYNNAGRRTGSGTPSAWMSRTVAFTFARRKGYVAS